MRRLLLCSQVASAFSQLLNLHNLTEEIITARVEKAARMGEVGLLNHWRVLAPWTTSYSHVQ